MARYTAVALAVVALLVAAGAAPAAGGVVGPTGQIAGSDVEADDTLLRIDLRADGSAQWAIEYRVRLDDENTTAAFDSLQADIEANETAFTDPFADRMRTAVDAAERATGREMALRNVTVTAEKRALPAEYGVVTYRFEWTNFAAADGDRLRAGDAVAGLFLDEGTTLVMSWPESHRLSSVDPDPDEERNDSVVWRGPTSFSDDQPAVVVAADSTAGGLPGWVLPAVGVALLAVAGAAYALRSRTRDESADQRSPTEVVSDATAAAGDGDAGDDAADGDATPDPPPELLSNEERVLRLLEGRGGRMKQQEIAGALEWTDAKTSQVLKGMREEGQLESFRLGRENVISLPDAGEPTPADDDESA